MLRVDSARALGLELDVLGLGAGGQPHPLGLGAGRQLHPLGVGRGLELDLLALGLGLRRCGRRARPLASVTCS